MIGAGWTDLQDVGADDALRGQRIARVPRLERCAQITLRDDRAAPARLEIADQQKDPVVGPSL